jgi:hypothetical protein
VFSAGLTNTNPQAMLEPFGIKLVDLQCKPLEIINSHVTPCLQTVAFGVDWSRPEVFIGTAGGFLSGLGFLAIISAFLQLIQSRMTLPPADPANDDPNVRLQRQMLLFVPLISVAYGSILPAGLFLYWIVGTIFMIIQQFLIIGWGSMFPLFRWTPSFAVDHSPRFPVTLPAARQIAPKPSDPKRPKAPTIPDDRQTSAERTIRRRGRQSRRGRRR